ncbi:MAG: hypothetical protein ACREP9_06930 [Candidatus Dormibacteraceae bacterium]
MLNREFVKTLRLLRGRSETITTKFVLDALGRKVEEVTLQTHEKPSDTQRVKTLKTHGLRS